MTDSLNEKTLKRRWLEHLYNSSIDLRSLLIDAVAKHEGWEESAVALIDEAIMPVLKNVEQSEISVVKELREKIENALDEEAEKFEYIGSNSEYWIERDMVVKIVSKYFDRFFPPKPVMGSVLSLADVISKMPDDLHDHDYIDTVMAVLDAAGVKYYVD